MAIFLRGDPEPVRAVREARLPGEVEVWMQSDPENEAPIITHMARLVADGGTNEIMDAIAASKASERRS